MGDETYNGWVNRETWAFNLHWQNDQGLYNDTLGAAQDWIDGKGQTDPTFEVSDSELGEYIVDYWRETIQDYELETLVPGTSAEPFWGALRMMRDEVGSWWRVDYAETGAAVREALGIES